MGTNITTLAVGYGVPVVLVDLSDDVLSASDVTVESVNRLLAALGRAALVIRDSAGRPAGASIIGPELKLDNFRTVQAMTSLVLRLRGAAGVGEDGGEPGEPARQDRRARR
jgi:hypothetical protein